jgi:hypothetical protein
MFVKIFHRDRAELIKDVPDFPIVIVQLASILDRHEQPIGLLTELAEVCLVVIAILKNEVDFAQVGGSNFIVGDVSGGQQGGNMKPDGDYHRVMS